MIEEVGGEIEVSLISFPQLKHVMGTDWRGDANCTKLPKSVFFEYNSLHLTKGERDSNKLTAMDACKSCAVREKCYEFAVLNNEPHGIWAGTLPKERKMLHNSFRTTGILEPLLVS